MNMEKSIERFGKVSACGAVAHAGGLPMLIAACPCVEPIMPRVVRVTKDPRS